MIRNWFFMRRHKRDCAATAARELALAGVAKRKREVRAVAQQIRRELGMPEHPALNSRLVHVHVRGSTERGN